MSEAGPLKYLSHDLLSDYVREFAPDIPKDGICNGFIAMWIQAVVTGEEHEANFYKRLDWLSAYFSNSSHTPKKLQKQIEHLFFKAKKRHYLSTDDLEKTDKRAFAESVAIQQNPWRLKLFKRYIAQSNKKILYNLTSSKAQKDQGIKINYTHIGVAPFTPTELKQYWDNIQKILLENEPDQKSAFSLTSDNHAVGIYLNKQTKKWHFLDINFLSNKITYYFEANSNEVAELIFHSFKDKKSQNTLFSIHYVSTYYKQRSETITALKMITENLLIYTVEQTNARGYNSLMLAIQHGNLEIIEDLIEKRPMMVNSLSDKNVSPLMIACELGIINLIKKLIAKGGNVNAVDKQGNTPLKLAISHGHIHTLETLIMAKADIQQTNGKNTCLIHAVCANSLPAIELLIKNGAKVNQTNHVGTTALMAAAQRGFTKVIELLINSDADASIINNYGLTALILASQNGHSEALKALLTQPLLFSIKKGYKAFIDHLSQKQCTQSDLLFNLRRLRV
jgi:ankyrin repeat protein